MDLRAISARWQPTLPQPPYIVALAASVTINTTDTNPNGVWAAIHSTVEAAGRYVVLDLSVCTAAGNTIEGGFFPTNNHFNIIERNEYIKGITLPSTLTSIGDEAFSGCGNLTSVTIPGSVTSIGYYAFRGSEGLTSVTIPGSVISIGISAFSSCTGLTTVTIGEGVTSIERQAFYWCTSLTSVTIPGSVTSIGEGAFGVCPSLTAITVAESNTVYSSQEGILYNKAKTTIITVPNTKSGALNLPDTLISIGDFAFGGCKGLTSVTIPAGVTSIGDFAFEGCSGLTAITVAESNTVYSSQDGILYNKAKTTIVEVPSAWAKSGMLNLPNTLTNIYGYAFIGSEGLTSVAIPSSVTSIGIRAFASCSNLTSVTFGTGSNIASGDFYSSAFPEGSAGLGGDSLRTAYLAASPKAGTYTRAANGSTWMKQ
jgi:hypothetical protein